jgi:hypothetical protein
MKTKFYKITFSCGCGESEDFITAENYDNAMRYAYESAVEDYLSYEGYHGIPGLDDIADEMFNKEFDELQKTPIYKYLSHASYETKNMKTSYNETFNIPINELTDKLFNRVVALQYKYDKTVTCPVVEPYYNGKYDSNWDYVHVKDNKVTSTAEALELAESYFNDWLDVNLREHEMGRTLIC